MAYGVCPNCKQGLEVPEGYELCTCGACGQQISTALALELGSQPQTAPEAPVAPVDAPVAAAEQTSAPVAPNTDAAPAPVPVPVPMQQAPLNPVDTNQQYYQASANAVAGDPEIIYDRTENNGLYLAAFILSLISCIGTGWLVVPLAWTIPMTVHTYGIYKGKKANTTGFSVCMLIFCSLIAGILLLVAGKDE